MSQYQKYIPPEYFSAHNGPGPNYSISELVTRVIDMRNEEPERVKFSELLENIKKKSPDSAATRIQSIHRGKKVSSYLWLFLLSFMFVIQMS